MKWRFGAVAVARVGAGGGVGGGVRFTQPEKWRLKTDWSDRVSIDPERDSPAQHSFSPERVCLLVGCLASQQHASVSRGRICTDNFTCCHTETEVADPTFYLTQSQYTDTGPTSPSSDPIMSFAWQGSHWSANFDSTPEKSRIKLDSNLGSSAPEATP